MDRLDRISVLAIVLLLIGCAAVIYDHPGKLQPPAGNQQKLFEAETAGATAEIDGARKLIKKLIESESLVQAESQIAELIRKYPYQGEPHLLMGDLLMRKQEPVNALHEYKQAIEFNPDYLDKKTPLFQGKKLKTAVGEALAEVEDRLGRYPADASLRSEKKLIYYLYRKIAGSCG